MSGKRYTVEPGRWIARDGTPIFAIMLNSDRAKWDQFGPTDADRMAHTVAALLNAEPHTMTGDKPPSPEFLNALRVYRSPDDAEMSLADQFRVIADRIKEDVNLADQFRAIADGISPAPTTRWVTFIGQAWINDHAVEVDDGRFRYMVTEAEYDEAGGDDADDYDALAQAREAPAIVREWSGPFEIEPDNQPVALTFLKEGMEKPIVVARFKTIKAAQEFLTTSATIDPDDREAGCYGIGAKRVDK